MAGLLIAAGIFGLFNKRESDEECRRRIQETENKYKAMSYNTSSRDKIVKIIKTAVRKQTSSLDPIQGLTREELQLLDNFNIQHYFPELEDVSQQYSIKFVVNCYDAHIIIFPTRSQQLYDAILPHIRNFNIRGGYYTGILSVNNVREIDINNFQLRNYFPNYADEIDIMINFNIANHKATITITRK